MEVNIPAFFFSIYIKKMSDPDCAGFPNSDIAEISENGWAGNTEPPSRKRKKSNEKKVIAEISEISTNTSYPAFHWVFTWNNYPRNWQDFFKDRKSLIEKICVGEETAPTTGTRHLQGWLRLYKKNVARTYLNLPTTISWRAMSRLATERQNMKYCTKNQQNILSWGIPVPYTINVRKQEWMIEMKTILEQEPDHRTIYWIWEPVGASGKTLFTKMMHLELDGVIFINGKGHDIRHCVADYTTRTGAHPKRVLMNVPRVNKDYVSYEALENVKDMAFYSGKYEGCIVNGPNPHVVIFANDRPDKEKMSEDRWKIGRIVEEKIVWECF